MSNTQSSILQTLTDLHINQEYTFQLEHKVSDATSDASLQCTSTVTNSDGQVDTTPFTFALAAGGGWLTYTKNFWPVAATSVVACTIGMTSGSSDIFLANMVVSRNC